MDGREPGVRRDWPFLIIVCVVIAGAAAVPLWRDPGLRAGGPAALIVALAAVNGALHAAFFLAEWARRRVWLYLFCQAAVAVGLGVATRTPVVTLTLCLMLIGEAVGSLPRRGAVAVAAALYSLFAAHAIIGGHDPEPLALLVAGVPTLLFVVVFVELMRRESKAREDAQGALADLHAAHEKLASYAAQVEELTLTGERQRIARELHDTLAQGLAGLILQLGALEAHLARGEAEKARAIVRHALERARATLAEARMAIDDLRAAPAASLAEHARSEARRFMLATGIACEVDVDERLPLPPEALPHVERCVCEGLANVARHARATKARVAGHVENGAVVLDIEDDGVGFDPAASDRGPGHYGLVGLRERARLSGATLEVTSGPGRGTRLRFTVPLREEAA